MKKICLSVIIFMALHAFAHGDDNIKKAALAGSWYPGTAQELGRMMDGFFSGVKDLPSGERDIGVIISPHAGYFFSGGVAAYGFTAAQAKTINTVVILAPTHSVSFSGASVWAEGAFETPLGQVEVDKELAQKILSYDKRFSFRKEPFAGAFDRPENSVETQIPFVQKAFPKAKIVPIILGYPPDAQTMAAVADALVVALAGREDVLVDVSVDQSHFHLDDEARKIDARGLGAIEKMDINALLAGQESGEMEVDGFHVVATAMLYAKKVGYDKAKVLKYATSADVTGEKDRVVGYASVMFYRDKGTAPEVAQTSKEAQQSVQPFNKAQKQRLVQIARETVDTFVRTGKAPEFTESDPRLLAEEGAFVTLSKQGHLRGCIGDILGSGPLYKTVREMAIAAASEDPRFNPVTPDELKDISVEISVLSKPQVVKSAEEIVLGKHGVIVSRGIFNRGVFLPQVATDTGWTKDRFLSELCSQKAGLPPLCWREPGTKLEVFTAQVFGEKEQ
jgi:AmmeMemoRadiSam system protein B/AmmeMemoRadiSam system protein A